MKISCTVNGDTHKFEVFKSWNWLLNNNGEEFLVTYIYGNGVCLDELLCSYYKDDPNKQLDVLKGINAPWFAIVSDSDDNLTLSWIDGGIHSESDIRRITEHPGIPVTIESAEEEFDGTEWHDSEDTGAYYFLGCTSADTVL